MLSAEGLYLLLEVEKVKQNHGRISTTFIYPTGGLAFSCVSYIRETKIIFTTSKHSIADPWSVELVNKKADEPFAYESNCLHDTIENYVEFLMQAPLEDVPRGASIWDNEQIPSNVLKILKRSAASARNIK